MQQVLDDLLRAPEYVNPAIALAVELLEAETQGDRDKVESAIRYGRVEHAIVDGEREGIAVMKALAACGHAPPVASNAVPEGF